MPPYMPTQQVTADFDLSVRFTLDNLGDLLLYPDDGPEPEARMSSIFWPGLKFRVSTVTEGPSKQRKCRLSLYMLPGDTMPPFTMHVTATLQSLSGCAYPTKPLRRQATIEHGRASIGTLLSLCMFESSETMQAEDAVVVHVSMRSASSPPSLRSQPTLNLIHRVLIAQPASKTRFIVFRRRDSAGHLSCPREFHADMNELASYFMGHDGLLEVTDRIEGFELPRGASLDDYSLMNDGHDSDSDFEPDEEEDDEDADIVVVRRDSSDDLPLPKNPGTRLIDDSPADSLVMQDSFIQNSIHNDLDESVQSTTGSFRLVHHKREEGSHLYSYSTFDGQTFVLLGTASRTWEALLYYLYTGSIDFAPLQPQKSSRRVASSSLPFQNGTTQKPGPVSCRSIYRLAYQLGLDDLRKHALQYLISQLSPETVLTEVFSEFTARYDEVKEMELALVVQYWDVLKASAAFKRKMVEVTNGSVPHAADVISEIMLRVSAKQA